MGILAPKVNDDCMTCADIWDSKKPPKPRKKLILATDTQNKHLSILLCPYCDGERAVKLSRAKK